MVNTTNLNMGVVMNQINPEVIRVSTEYYILLILNNKIKTSDEPERVKQYYITTKYSVNWHLKSFYTLEFRYWRKYKSELVLKGQNSSLILQKYFDFIFIQGGL